MKFLLFLTVGFAITIFSSCDDSTPQPQSKTGTLKLSNLSDNPYQIYIDGIYVFDVAGNYTKSIEKATGEYTVRVLQKSGYLFYPTEETHHVNIYTGQQYTLYFPKNKK
ncbi:MAG: hypothetical protein FWC39_10245 [Bacteroidetes bacterium]|nr:hypothetical protein [Bacteroidota bacterium]